MRLVTKKGTFDSFATLRGAYINSKVDMALDPKHADPKEWADDKLHASEVGYCPRMQMLRLVGAPRKIKLALTQAMDDYMWWVGYRTHYLTYEAMDWAGILFSHETQLFDGLWAGSCDALFYPDVNQDELMGYDCKTTRPKGYNFAYEVPKEAHVLQVSTYGIKLPRVPNWVIEYIYFGSTKPPIECLVTVTDYQDAVLGRMLSLEAYRKAALENPGDLPPVLTERFVPKYRKDNGQQTKSLVGISYSCSWECGYCDWHHTYPPKDENDKFPPTREDSPCKPPWHEPLELLNITKKYGYRYPNQCPAGDAALAQFLDSQLKTVPIVGGQEDEEE